MELLKGSKMSLRIRKVLITSAAGFIGSHLTELLVEQGYSVKAFVHYNSRNYWGWLEESKYKNEIEFISGDIRNYKLMEVNQ